MTKRLIAELAASAREIAKDDPELLTSGFDAFERVMWSDDEHFRQCNISRGAYSDLLRSVYRELGGV